MQELTKAEDQIMQILWKLEKAFVNNIIDKFPSPKPAYNTVSTTVRILERKGFVDHKAYGKTHEYFPIIPKEKYIRFYLNKMMKGYFDGSIHNLMSFYVKENNIGVIEIDELIRLLKGIKNFNKIKIKGKIVAT